MSSFLAASVMPLSHLTSQSLPALLTANVLDFSLSVCRSFSWMVICTLLMGWKRLEPRPKQSIYFICIQSNCSSVWQSNMWKGKRLAGWWPACGYELKKHTCKDWLFSCPLCHPIFCMKLGITLPIVKLTTR
jgi:hypothetical protein